MEFLQKLPYLFTIFLPIAVFFALGLWIAWWAWYRHAKTLKAAYSAGADLGTELGTLRKREHALSLRALGLLNKRQATWLADIQSKDAEVSKLSGKLGAFETETHELKSQFAEKERHFGELKLQLQSLGEEKKTEISGLASKLGGFEADLKNRDGELRTLRADLGSREGEIAKYKTELGAKESTINELSADLNTRTGERDKLDAELQKKSADLSARSEDLSILKADLAAKGDNIDNLHKELGAKSDETAKLKAELASKSGEASKLSAELAARTADANGLRKDVSDKTSQAAKLESRLTERSAEIASLKADLEAHAGDLTTVRADLAAREKQLEGLQSQLRSSNETKGKLEAQLAERGSDIESLREAIASKTKEAADLEKQVREVNGRVAKGETEIEKLEAALAAGRADLSGLQNSLGAREKSLADLTNSLTGERKDWDVKSKTLSNDLAKRGTTIQDLQTKLDTLTAAREKDAQERLALIAEREATIKSLKGELGDLESALGDRKKELEQLTADVTARDGDLKNLRATISKKEGEFATLTAEATQLRTQAEDTSAQDALSAELAGLQTSLAATESALATEQEKAARISSGLALFDGEDVAEDHELGWVYTERPDSVDDLTQISGVGGVLEGKLHNFGVYRFKQIALWDQTRLDTFSDRLDFKGRVEREMWVHQACDLHHATYGERLRPMTDIYRQPMTRTVVKGSDPAAVDAAFEGEAVSRDESLGLVFKERPDQVDDLKEISGVAGVLEGKLHDFGIYRFKQIALWQREQIDTFGERLNFPDRIDRDMWVHQAVDLHFENYDEHLTPQVPIYRKPEIRTRTSTVIKMPAAEPVSPYPGESIREDEKLGTLFTTRPAQVDDLKRIKGIATVLEQKLHEFGIYRFKQIASWSPSVVAEFSERLSFKDRVERDNWKGQAALFHRELYGETLPGEVLVSERELATT